MSQEERGDRRPAGRLVDAIHADAVLHVRARPRRILVSIALVLALAASGVAIALLTQDGNRSPSEAVEQFVSAYNGKNFDKACELSTPTMRKGYQELAWWIDPLDRAQSCAEALAYLKPKNFGDISISPVRIRDVDFSRGGASVKTESGTWSVKKAGDGYEISKVPAFDARQTYLYNRFYEASDHGHFSDDHNGDCEPRDDADCRPVSGTIRPFFTPF
jgi:hypothetical protein